MTTYAARLTNIGLVVTDIFRRICRFLLSRPTCYLLFSNQNCYIAMCFWMAVPQRRLANFFTLIGCHGNVPWPMAKYSTVPSSACKALSWGEKMVNIGLVYLEIFDEIRWTTTSTRNAISISRFTAETTGPIFTNPAHTRRYLVPFRNTRATKVERLPIFAQNRLPWQRPLRYRKKEVQIDHLHPKSFHST